MKRKNMGYALLATILLFSCNKGSNDFLYKGGMLPFTIKGYNGSSDVLDVKVDTFELKNDLKTGTFNITEAYLFPDNRSNVKLTITEKQSGKLVLEKDLQKDGGPATISFFYMDGKAGDMPEVPPVEAGKIKLTYLFKPTLTGYTGDVDIALGKYFFTPKVFEEVARIRNVKPNQFTEPFTMPTFQTAGQQYNGQPTSVLFKAYIYKAGTNEFYTNGTAYTWNATNSTAPVPAAATGSSKLYIFSEGTLGSAISFVKQLEL